MRLSPVPVVVVLLVWLSGFSSATPVEEAAEAIFTKAAETGEIEAAAAEARQLFDQLVLYGAAPEGHDFAAAATVRRLLEQVAAARVDRQAVLRYLRQTPKLARVLPMLVGDRDDVTAVYTLLGRLAEVHGTDLDDYANLAAAICVVHDQRITRRVNENTVSAPDPLTIYDYFVQNADKMRFGIRDMPAELLIYVVDTTAEIDEMEWALQRYRTDPDLGRRFHEIEYDYAHAYQGATKKVTQAGLTLPNIKRYGGVCADQTYFAVSVGKSMGIPAVYTRGRSGDVGHAWVGYLESRGGRPAWNFDSGRYEAYQGLRGLSEDPQRGEQVDDSRVSLLAEFVQEPMRDRHAAAALTEAAGRLWEWRKASGPPKLTPTAGAGGVARDASVASQLQLLEAAIETCPTYAPAWDQVEALAGAGELDLDQKKRFSDALLRLCGTRYPYFSTDVLSDMIATVEDPRSQHELWERLYEQVSARHLDLAGGIRLAQGRLWERAGEPAKAGRCFQDVIERYPNAGPFAVEALIAAEGLIRQAGNTRRLPELFGPAWKSMDRPGLDFYFARGSNWYRTGQRYAQVLDEIGQTRDAKRVRAVLEDFEGKNPR